MEDFIRVENLAVSFDTYDGEVQAVRGVSWYVKKGETIGIVGESGCGKSVTIQTVLGLYPPGVERIKSGRVMFEGEDLLTKTPKEMRDFQGKKLSIIFQDPFTYLNPTMTVGNQIMEMYLNHFHVSKQEAREKALEVMRMISIPNPEEMLKNYPHQLSGGLRQRIMITMAMICEPLVLFADEPTTALDVTVQAQIIELMNGLKDRVDTSIVLITHDMGVVANMADRIYVMYAGKIVESGSKKEIFYEAKHPYTKGLLRAVPDLSDRTVSDLYTIPGAPPDLLNPPAGCAFCSRCSYAMNICRRLDPIEYQFGDGEHKASCWLYHDQCKVNIEKN